MPQGFGQLVASKKRKRFNGQGEDEDNDEIEKANPTTIESIRHRRSAKQVEEDETPKKQVFLVNILFQNLL
jgi:hypothetical protein